ncbi:hypothetical protein Bca4012_027785 [Brassica carinata]|uniref:NB-ARC domain-containing protein n=1 Tax=Brassica carinata TaxID=52824 RepID=A0A8X8AW62_BRACI|nr:hypothetical protein Bca52824_024780 [Brassica carinata]
MTIGLDREDDSKMLDDIILTIASVKSRSESSGENISPRRQQRVVVPAESSRLGDMWSHISQSGSAEAELERDAHRFTSLTDDDSNGLVGMYRHKTAVHELLDLGSKNVVRTVGIWGESGVVGKTTLAECVFDDISDRFQHHCFLSNVNRHVLLVIDGARYTRRNEQLKNAMMVSHWLGPGSRVIMTLKSDPPSSCGFKYTYKMESMRYEEALQLFSLCAFKRPCPLVGFEGLSIRAVHFAGRLPLALKVLGSFLYDKDLESWKSTLRNLEASQDNGSCQVSNYIGARAYLPRRQTELEHYIREDEENHSGSYHMLL